MGSRSTLAGLEVPNPAAIQDYCSSISIGEPPTYIIWRIHKHLPHILELLEFCANKEFPKVGLQGLRIIFREALSPLIFLCKNEVFCGIENAYPYLLYALTVSGIANLLRLRTIASYASGSVIQPDDLLDYGLGVLRPITSAAATPSGCLVIGRNDGSLLCYQLATVIPSYPGFRQELRDDPGIGSLWGLMSRGRVSAVQDLVISMVHGKTLVFVLHTDGILRVWDFIS
ncbi:hypothetical protein M0R45_016064 [Rubus argutus]|uniref:Nucleoporin Nup120/160 beta-propeller domain-containing protein n=1 Tax=Rubus argutus TaxID=59490 RepID=A0AAW1XS00_RUBAR